MKMIVQAVPVGQVNAIVDDVCLSMLSESMRHRFYGEWPDLYLWINNVAVKVDPKGSFSREPSIIPIDKSVKILETWGSLCAKNSGSKLRIFFRSQKHTDFFFLLDMEERTSGHMSYPWREEMVLGVLWSSRKKKPQVEVIMNANMAPALGSHGKEEEPYYTHTRLRPPLQDKFLLTQSSAVQWFRRAVKEAAEFVKIQKECATRYSITNPDAPNAHQMCLWMWRSTLLGRFLERHELG